MVGGRYLTGNKNLQTNAFSLQTVTLKTLLFLRPNPYTPDWGQHRHAPFHKLNRLPENPRNRGQVAFLVGALSLAGDAMWLLPSVTLEGLGALWYAVNKE